MEAEIQALQATMGLSVSVEQAKFGRVGPQYAMSDSDDEMDREEEEHARRHRGTKKHNILQQ
jgi:hypothetical protein